MTLCLLEEARVAALSLWQQTSVLSKHEVPYTIGLWLTGIELSVQIQGAPSGFQRPTLALWDSSRRMAYFLGGAWSPMPTLLIPLAY